MRNLAGWQFMWLIIKDDQLRDNPPKPQCGLGQSSGNSFLPVYMSHGLQVMPL
jgi:hypothetical protein